MPASLAFKSLITLTLVAVINHSSAYAHQPVTLSAANKSADFGPILVDGSISFALRANFSKANQSQGFRAILKSTDQLNLEYLIIDSLPENKLTMNKLPVTTVTYPSGKKLVMKLNERTKFYEPYGGTNYLYLGRFSAPAEEGLYKVNIKSKGAAKITVAFGSKETFGQVLPAAVCPELDAQRDLPAIPTAYALALVSMKKNQAATCATKLGWGYRIGQEDEQLFALTKDYRMDRVTVTIKKGLITESIVG